MKKIILFFLLIIINTFVVYGSNIVTGYVTINIRNDPPEIKSISFEQSEVYEDSVIKCKAEVIDESPNTVQLRYNWFINGNPLNINTDSLAPDYFSSNDIVTCMITPNDLVQDGKPKNVSVSVKPIPIGTRVTKGVLQLAGVSSSAEEIISIKKEKGMLGVTGFVVKEIGTNSESLTITFLIFILMIAFLVTANLVIRTSIKRHKI